MRSFIKLIVGEDGDFALGINDQYHAHIANVKLEASNLFNGPEAHISFDLGNFQYEGEAEVFVDSLMNLDENKEIAKKVYNMLDERLDDV